MDETTIYGPVELESLLRGVPDPDHPDLLDFYLDDEERVEIARDLRERHDIPLFMDPRAYPFCEGLRLLPRACDLCYERPDELSIVRFLRTPGDPRATGGSVSHSYAHMKLRQIAKAQARIFSESDAWLFTLELGIPTPVAASFKAPGRLIQLQRHLPIDWIEWWHARCTGQWQQVRYSSLPPPSRSNVTSLIQFQRAAE